ncbi:hypothetical protein [Methylobacter tundripaludum]|uniref:Transmembrane protein n=1 Tax=Methylobacter tundripaludum (strain ATCC BAA-1195 / DSM 17260 / SV96) TaxID=697282 RepID=G3J0F3_METTV|nr:hypothetical protein [Methylobacter tundripaludum]EGW20675.1 hypothetical protein Mettu_3824 [Methylobacter tundripaludum SV96]
MSDNINNDTDLSAGNSTPENTVLTDVLLSEQRQKETFRNRSFFWAWIFSGLFFFSVLAFSWSIMFCPDVFLLTKTIHSAEQRTATLPSDAKNKPVTKNTKKSVPADKRSPELESKDQLGNFFNQFLMMIALLAAIGTTLAIAVMRFSFSNNKDCERENIIPISPVASSLAELLSQIAELKSLFLAHKKPVL